MDAERDRRYEDYQRKWNERALKMKQPIKGNGISIEYSRLFDDSREDKDADFER